MTKDEILAEFESLLASQPDPEGYYTVDELGSVFGSAGQNLGRVAVQRRLKIVQQAGRLSVVKVKRPAIDGRMMHAPAYRILPDKAGVVNMAPANKLHAV